MPSLTLELPLNCSGNGNGIAPFVTLECVEACIACAADARITCLLQALLDALARDPWCLEPDARLRWTEAVESTEEVWERCCLPDVDALRQCASVKETVAKLHARTPFEMLPQATRVSALEMYLQTFPPPEV